MTAAVIRDATPQDADAIRAIHAQSFGGRQEADLVDALIAGGEAAISLIAEAEGRAAGHILFSPALLIFDDRAERALALAPLGVLPDFQRRGVGARLIRDGLAQAMVAGWRAVFVLGDPAYYTRFGFLAETVAGLASPYAGPHFMGLELTPGALKGTGGRVAYATPFAALG